MTNQHTQQHSPQQPKPTPSAGEDLPGKHLLDSPPDPSPQPNPESAPGGDKVGGEMTTAPFTGAALNPEHPHKDKPTPHK
jgi:hypothetical protein